MRQSVLCVDSYISGPNSGIQENCVYTVVGRYTGPGRGGGMEGWVKLEKPRGDFLAYRFVNLRFADYIKLLQQ